MRRRWADAAVVAIACAGLAGCASGDGRELADAVEPLPTTTTSVPPATPLTVDLPTVVTGVPTTAGSVVIERLSSPENAIALIEGFGAASTDPITVDDAPGDVIEFDVAADGSFVARVFVADEGAHTVCVAATCGRVYTLDPDAESPEEVVAKIDEAIPIARGIVPVDVWFPEWSITVGGLLSGTGGTADASAHEVIVYRNRGRTVDDFVRTIVHEYGHVADFEWLDDDLRAEFAALRGFAPETVWEGNGGHRMSDWEGSPAEDFAEAIAAFWSGEQWDIRTDGGPLTPDVEAFLDRLTTSNT